MYKICLIVGIHDQSDNELNFRGLIGLRLEEEVHKYIFRLYWNGPENIARSAAWVGRAELTWNQSRIIRLSQDTALVAHAKLLTVWDGLKIPPEQKPYVMFPSLKLMNLPHIQLTPQHTVILDQLDNACVAFYNSF